MPSQLASTGCEVEGQHAENERKRRHQNRAQAEFGGLNGGVDQAATLFEQLLGKFDDQNGVLRRESDQHDQTYLHVNVIHQSASVDEQQRSQNCHGHRQQDDERQREALILS